MPKKKKINKRENGETSYNKKSLTKLISTIFSTNPSQIYNYKQIAKRLEVEDTAARQLINVVLQELSEEKILDELHTGKYKFHTASGYIKGTVEMINREKARIITADVPDEVIVWSDNLHHALPGDEVKVYLHAKRKQENLQGEVVQIITEGKRHFVGEIEIRAHFAFLLSGKNIPFDIFIPLEKLNGAKHGQKVIAAIDDWPADAKNPTGQVLEVLGDTGDNNTEMHAILAEFGLPAKFDPEIDRAAEKISDVISQEEISKRRDFRKILTFTIDPIDAKDFDDAISIQKLGDDRWEVGVHIADVTHYVDINTILDKEALSRATSVYLVDRVVPMLPERLSNYICSLRPDEDKLTFSAVFEIDANATIYNQWFGKTIIRSARRFNYDEVQKIIDAKDGDLKDEILLLNSMAQKLRANRFKGGSIAFDRYEMKFNLDEKGKPLGVYYKSSNYATQLVEEFMLQANKSVAERIGKEKRKAKTFVYRIHDKPDYDKLVQFNAFVRKYGLEIKLSSNKEVARSLNQLFDKTDGRPEQDIISNMAVRAMAKAVYSTQNIGHYGLAFPHYTHFTSPIRRYPDMMVHRLLERYLANGQSVSAELYEEMCKHSSDMEKRATDAERASVKYKQVEFMADKIGDEFEAIISGVTSWGIFVQLTETKVEGMIALRDMEDDYYIFDEKNFCIIGQRNKEKFSLGDSLKVKLVRINVPRKQIDFMMVDKIKSNNRPPLKVKFRKRR